MHLLPRQCRRDHWHGWTFSIGIFGVCWLGTSNAEESHEGRSEVAEVVRILVAEEWHTNDRDCDHSYQQCENERTETILSKKKGMSLTLQNQCAHILCWPLSSHLLVLYRSSQFPSFITTRPRTLLWSLLRLTSPLFSPTNLSLECMEMPQTEQLLEWHPAWPSGVKD